MNNLGGMMAVFGGAFIFVVIIAIASYVVCALAYRKVLLYFGHERDWLAFIPVANAIALVQCMRADGAGNVAIFGQNISRNVFQWYPFLPIILQFIPAIGTLLSFAVRVIASAHVYKDLLSAESGQDETVLGWVCAIIPIVWIVLCFVRFKN